MKILLAILTVSLLMGCAQVKEILTIKPMIVERPTLVIQKPRPVQSKSVEFSIITKDNMEEIFSEMEKKDQDMVFFALTDDGYKALSLSIADMRRFIVQQNAVIKAYKQYYEPETEVVTKK